MIGYEIVITALVGVFGSLLTLGVGIMTFRNSSNANTISAADSYTNVEDSIANLSAGIITNIATLTSTVTELAKNIGNVQSGPIEVDKRLDKGLDSLPVRVQDNSKLLNEVKNESAVAHDGIATNQVNKWTKILIRESKNRIVSHMTGNSPTSGSSDFLRINRGTSHRYQPLTRKELVFDCHGLSG